MKLKFIAREGKEVPKKKKYKIRVDKEKFTIENETISGLEILNLVNKPAESYYLYQHFHKGQTKLIKP